MALELTRPLVFLKVETTGLDPERDRIVAIAALKRYPDERKEARFRLLNPGVAIPPDATAVHGITDEDVAGQPPFRRIARSLAVFLADSDLVGYNIARFDLPFLEAEFARAGIPFERPPVVDLLTIFRRMEPRTLAAAARFYLGQDPDPQISRPQLLQALLEAQLERYPTLPRSVPELADLCKPPEWIDSQGWLRWVNGVATIQYGRQYRGHSLEEVARTDPAHLDWAVNESRLPQEVKAILRAARAGRFPVPPATLQGEEPAAAVEAEEEFSSPPSPSGGTVFS
jgi:DNA polymerase-3 subunit epsilon